MQQEQSVASEKSKLDAQNALASGDITTLQKQLRNQLVNRITQAVVESLQGEISDMKAILLNTEHKLQEKEQQVENLKLECEDLKNLKTVLRLLNKVPVLTAHCWRINKSEKTRKRKIAACRSRANNDHLETEMEEMRDVIKKLNQKSIKKALNWKLPTPRP